MIVEILNYYANHKNIPLYFYALTIRGILPVVCMFFVNLFEEMIVRYEGSYVHVLLRAVVDYIIQQCFVLSSVCATDLLPGR